MKSRQERLEKRKKSIRKKINGTAEKPRLRVYRSGKHIYVQAVDDLAGQTLVSASTCDKEVRGMVKGYTGNMEAAKTVGRVLAERLKQKGVTAAVFDRGGYLFHGRVKALADAARENGVAF